MIIAKCIQSSLCAKQRPRCFACMTSLTLSQQHFETALIIPILEMRKLSLGEINSLNSTQPGSRIAATGTQIWCQIQLSFRCTTSHQRKEMHRALELIGVCHWVQLSLSKGMGGNNISDYIVSVPLLPSHSGFFFMSLVVEDVFW